MPIKCSWYFKEGSQSVQDYVALNSFWKSTTKLCIACYIGDVGYLDIVDSENYICPSSIGIPSNIYLPLSFLRC